MLSSFQGVIYPNLPESYTFEDDLLDNQVDKFITSQFTTRLVGLPNGTAWPSCNLAERIKSLYSHSIIA